MKLANMYEVKAHSSLELPLKYYQIHKHTTVMTFLTILEIKDIFQPHIGFKSMWVVNRGQYLCCRAKTRRHNSVKD